MERSTCIACRKKLVRRKMIKFGQHWLCESCVNESPGRAVGQSGDPGKRIKVLNLYAGVGGNRFLWPGTLEVTAVEWDVRVAAEYKRNFPLDRIVIGDAHKYLIEHYQEFDIICSSYPCQTHTKMNYIQVKKRYADLGLYQEIIFLRSFFKGKWYVENVNPYYDPLIKADFKICRHLFWTNVPQLSDVKLPEFEPRYRGRNKGINIMPKAAICRWLGIPPGDKNIYFKSGKSAEQVYRNCVHPKLGVSLMNDILKSMAGV